MGTHAQFLHCLEFDNEVNGGATTLLDAFAAAEHFRDNFPEKFEVHLRWACLVSEATPHLEVFSSIFGDL